MARGAVHQEASGHDGVGRERPADAAARGDPSTRRGRWCRAGSPLPAAATEAADNGLSHGAGLADIDGRRREAGRIGMTLVEGPQERVDLAGPQGATKPFVLATDGVA